jgi:hypothetical protein
MLLYVASAARRLLLDSVLPPVPAFPFRRPEKGEGSVIIDDVVNSNSRLGRRSMFTAKLDLHLPGSGDLILALVSRRRVQMADTFWQRWNLFFCCGELGSGVELAVGDETKQNESLVCVLFFLHVRDPRVQGICAKRYIPTKSCLSGALTACFPSCGDFFGVGI